VTREQNTSRTGNCAGSANTNGHNGHHADDPAPTALSGTLLAHLCDIDPDTPLNEALTAEALAAFAVYNSARRKVGLTPYAGDAPLCDIAALPIAVGHLMGQEPTRGQIAGWSAEAMEDDPHDVMAEFDTAKAEYTARRARERAADREAERALREEKISPHARFTLETIEDIEDIGPEIARQARAAVLKVNRWAWSAIEPYNHTERNDLISAVELNRLGVDAAVIAALVADGRSATDDDEIEANERLARARVHYAKYGTAEVIDVAAGMVSPEQMRDKQPPRRMLGHWLYFAQLAELIAEAGGGKTFVALGMALSLALGKARQTIGLSAPQRVKVLYVAAEAHESVYLRVLGWCQHHGVAPAALGGWLYVYPGAVQLSDPEHMRQVRKYANDNAIELVIFDTRHMVTMGLEENSSSDQGVAVGALKALNADGVATLVVHHTTKDGKVGGGGRGAGAWFAAAYTSLYLKRDEKLGPMLVCDKVKDGKAKCKHPLHYAPVKVSAELMPNARDNERDTLALTGIDPFSEAADPREPSAKALNLLLMIAHHAGFKGLTVAEIKKRVRTKDDPDTGYDVGSQQTIYDSLAVLRDVKGEAAVRYVRAVGESPMRCRVTDEGWDLLVERKLVTAQYAEAHRYTAEDVGTEQFRAASENIAAGMTELIKGGEILATDKQTEPAARKLVESYMSRLEQEFSAVAWAAVYSRWKDDGRPAKVETAAQAKSSPDLGL
jgi:hypothetical protein